ncbi:MAG: CidA/LrgA family protein [Alistipes sp.]|nr:CidA/LrgA family protein [Alistipes sp.]
MKAIVLILIFWLAGNAVSSMTGNVVSGNVIGMMMLFLALKLRAVKAETVRPAAHFLTANMAVCFVPFGVGLMVSYGAIADNLAAIAVSAAVSTVLVLVCVGRVTQRLYKNR